MNRVELKSKAKEMIKGNKWHLWKPLVIFAVISCVITGIAFAIDGKTTVDEVTGLTNISGGVIFDIVSSLVGIVSSIFSVGYAMYVLSFVRGKKLEISDIIDFAKKHWVVAILTSLLVGVIVLAGMILLVVPGIIASIGLCFYKEVCADNPEMKVTDIVKKSWNMTNGHKGELFVLGLSFIGWCILAGFTFGILYIWVYPYMLVTMTLAYEELKKSA